MSAPTDHFPRDTGGLPAATPAGLVELARGQRFELADRAGEQADRRRHGADAGLQRLDSRADAAGPPGLGDRGRRRQRRRPGADGALARPAPGQPLRRHPRDPGADPRRRPLLLPRAVPRPRRLLVPPAHPRGLRPGTGPVRQRDRRARGPRLLGAGAPRARASRSTTSCSRTADRAVQPPRPTTRPWAASANAAGRRRAGTRADRQARRGRALLPDEHRQHARLQGRAARRPHEARRRRQRPRRARGVRRGRRARAVGAGRRRRAVRAARRARAGAPHPGADLPPGARSRSPTSAPSRTWSRRSTTCVATRELTAERERLAPWLAAEPDKTLAFVAEMDFERRRGHPPSTSARCIPRSSARSRAAARGAA